LKATVTSSPSLLLLTSWNFLAWTMGILGNVVKRGCLFCAHHQPCPAHRNETKRSFLHLPCCHDVALVQWALVLEALSVQDGVDAPCEWDLQPSTSRPILRTGMSMVSISCASMWYLTPAHAVHYMYYSSPNACVSISLHSTSVPLLPCYTHVSCGTGIGAVAMAPAAPADRLASAPTLLRSHH